jgi:hypothetical protein
MQGLSEPPDIPLEIMTSPCGQLPLSGPDLARNDHDDPSPSDEADVPRSPSDSQDHPVHIKPTRDRRLPARFRDFVM